MKMKLGAEPQERAIARILELKMTYWVDTMRTDLAKMPQDEANRICEHVMAWADAEIRERATITIAAKINAAKFIKTQTIDQFDFDVCISTRKLKKSYLELHEKAKSGELSRAIFFGQAGLGKTHLARALGYAACQAKTNVLFSTAAKITNKLATAKSIHNLESEINKFTRPRILIIDELGYVNMDTEASNLFFQLISARHDQEE
jgi:DNA replication protein DnaC